MTDNPSTKTSLGVRKPFWGRVKAWALAVQDTIQGWRAAAKIMRAAQSPLEKYDEFGRIFTRHPLILMFVAFIPLSVFSRFTPTPFRDLSLMANGTILTVAAIVYLFAKRAWLGRWHYYGVQHNIPLVWVHCAFYTTAHAIFHLGFGGLVMDATWERSLQRFFIALPIAVFLTAMAAFMFAPLKRELFSKQGQLVPILWPISEQVARQVTAFGAADLGQLRWMQADQNATRVMTEKGLLTLGRKLSDIVAVTDPKLGLQCHRSLWVARGEVRDVVHLNGNPHVVLADETVLPVSRSAVAALRVLVAQNKSKVIEKAVTRLH